MDFHLTISRRPVKYMRLKVAGENAVHLVLPWLASKKKGLEFVESKKEWIQKSLWKKSEKKSHPFSFLGKNYDLILTDEEQSEIVMFLDEKVSIHARNTTVATKLFQAFLAQQGKKILSEEIMTISTTIGIEFQKLTIRRQKSRWGSCTRDKNISLNLALIHLPQELRAYVMIHELCHTKEMNHSQKFWKLVEQFCPNHTSLRTELRQYELSVLHQ